MNDLNKKCSSKEHENIEANSYCHECKIYICKKCEKFHSILFQNHLVSKTSNDLDQIFTGICKVKGHSDKLKYFCKTHNVLCCAACISKIKDDENGQHKKCKICSIDKIKNIKKNNLSDNLKSLENWSLSLQDSINEIKIIFEKINENKKNIKIKIQQIFSKIRNEINKREDEILLKVDEKFDTLFFKEDMVKECDKLPNKIEMSLQKGKIINDSWNDQNKINSLINDCINIENNIKYINDLSQIMRKCKSINLNVEFIPKKRGISSLLETIKTFGGIKFNNFKFKKCPKKISRNREYEISGEDENILTKTGTDEEWMGTICENKLDKSKECIWEIKVLKTEENKIMVGVASEDFDINSSLYDNCGWYYYLYDDSLISESTSDKQVSKDEIRSNVSEEEVKKDSNINNQNFEENLNFYDERREMSEMIQIKDNYNLNKKNIKMSKMNQPMNNSYSEYQFQTINRINQQNLNSRPVYQLQAKNKMNQNVFNTNSEYQFQTMSQQNQQNFNPRPVYQLQTKNKMNQKELNSRQVYPIQATSRMNKIDLNYNSEYQMQESNKMEEKEMILDSDSKYKKKSNKEKDKSSDSDSKCKKKQKKKKEVILDSNSKYKKKTKKKKDESSDSDSKCKKEKRESSDSDSECKKEKRESLDSDSEYKKEKRESSYSESENENKSSDLDSERKKEKKKCSDSEEEESSEPDKKKKKISSSEEDSEGNERNEDKKIEIKNVTQEITIILNFEKKALKFLKNNEIKGELSDINIDKPLYPAVFLYNIDDRIKIEGFC